MPVLTKAEIEAENVELRRRIAEADAREISEKLVEADVATLDGGSVVPPAVAKAAKKAAKRAASANGLVLTTLTEEELAFVERVPVFELDGRGYTIEKMPRLDIALSYLRIARKHGDNAAIAYLLEESLGESAFEALSNHKGLKPEEFSQIYAIVQRHVLGGLEAPKGR